MTLQLFAPYSLLPYEKRFLEAEVAALGGKVLEAHQGAWQVNLSEDAARRLTYVREFRNGHPETLRTTQGRCEEPGGRQSTRYGPHAMHEYKGKFNPQTPRSLILQSRLAANDVLLDPFCGSGTTLVEARQLGLQSVGIELHPLAHFVSLAKQSWFRRPEAIIPTPGVLQGMEKAPFSSPNQAYLEKWFPTDQLDAIRRILAWTEGCGKADANVAKTILSDLLREHSFQDPRDLRIRRRAKVPTDRDIFASFVARLDRTWAERRRWHSEGLVAKTLPAKVHLGSATNISEVLEEGSVAATVTSPPYATALPYSDTYRLSNVVLGLVEADELSILERDLAGSREVRADDRALFDARVDSLPESLGKVLSGLHQATTDDAQAGFRKRALPLALARYWCTIKEVLIELKLVERPAAVNHWVVGPNQTEVSGRKILIDTPKMLAELARDLDFSSVSIEPLDAYGRFDLHSNNSIRSESLVRFRAPSR
jgi:hypothetical protein